MSTPVHRFRMAMAAHLGKVMTPEMAAQIEMAAFYVPPTPIDTRQFEPQTCGSITFAVERFADVLEELHPLHEEHWLETEAFRHALDMRPDYDAMTQEDLAGTMVQITARKDGALVGHLRLYIRRSRHTQTLFASEDALFLRAEARGGRTAMRMVQFSESVLKQLGVTQVRCNSKLKNNAARFMEGCGYTPFATELVKWL